MSVKVRRTVSVTSDGWSNDVAIRGLVQALQEELKPEFGGSAERLSLTEDRDRRYGGIRLKARLTVVREGRL